MKLEKITKLGVSYSVLFAKYYVCGRSKNDETGGIMKRMGEIKKCIKNFGRKI
jgi:hypothetical protein